MVFCLQIHKQSIVCLCSLFLKHGRLCPHILEACWAVGSKELASTIRLESGSSKDASPSAFSEALKVFCQRQSCSESDTLRALARQAASHVKTVCFSERLDCESRVSAYFSPSSKPSAPESSKSAAAAGASPPRSGGFSALYHHDDPSWGEDDLGPSTPPFDTIDGDIIPCVSLSSPTDPERQPTAATQTQPFPAPVYPGSDFAEVTEVGEAIQSVLHSWASGFSELSAQLQFQASRVTEALIKARSSTQLPPESLSVVLLDALAASRGALGNLEASCPTAPAALQSLLSKLLQRSVKSSEFRTHFLQWF